MNIKIYLACNINSTYCLLLALYHRQKQQIHLHYVRTRTVVRKKVSNSGVLRFCGGALDLSGGLDIEKLTKIQLIIMNVSCFNLGGLGALCGGAKPPVATGLVRTVCLQLFFVLHLS